MTVKIDHIAIAVESLDEAVRLFEKILGLRISRREYVPGYGVETATFNLGEAAIELVEGRGEASAVRKFIESHGPGIHHIALSVGDIGRTLSRLKANGILPVDETPSPGRDGTRVAFLHPKSTLKVLVELVERTDEGKGVK